MPDFREYALGAKPDRQDRRDIYKAAPLVDLPPHAEVTYQPAIQDQGRTNACTGYASAYFWEQVLVSRGMLAQRLSPTYPWFFARRYENSEMFNEGNTLRSIMRALHEFGICPIDEWRETEPWGVEPDDRAQVFGKALTLPRYERCETLREIKYGVSQEGQSCVLGVWVRSSWYSDESIRTGKLFHEGMIEGGHGVAVVGYDDSFDIGGERGAIKCPNSWGIGYGDRGFIYLPYRLFEMEPFDCWTVGFDAIPDAIPTP